MGLGPLEAVQQQCVALIEYSLRNTAGVTARVLQDDELYRRLVVDPAWDMLPMPIRLLGRKRLCWDELFNALRNEVLCANGGVVTLRSSPKDAVARLTATVLARNALGNRAPARSSNLHSTTVESVRLNQGQHRDGTVVGIDLGTTFSVVAHLDSVGRPWTIPNAEGDLLTPSVVFFDRSGTVVGKEAAKAAAISPNDVAQFVKLDMGSSVYEKPIHGEMLPPEVVQSFILEKLRHDASLKLGDVRRAVISVPAFFNEPRRKATQDAGALAGLDVIDIINEPTAAAIAYGVQQGFLTAKGEAKDRERILVYDLGGGTFDVTIMEIDGPNYTAVATAGDVRLGGIDWDRRIADFVAETYAKRFRGTDPRANPVGMQRLLREAEDAKRALSSRDEATILFEYAGEVVRVTLTRARFEQMTADLLDRTRFTTVNLLQEAGMQWATITRLLLVGGSSRMPMVQEMLERVSGMKTNRSLSADESVAHGAAIYAGLLDSAVYGTAPNIYVRNVNSHNLGVLGIEPATGRQRTHVMIPRNTRLPATQSARFVTMRPGQKSVAVNVVEGGDLSGNDATRIGRCIVKNLPPNLAVGTPVEVTFRYADDGRLTVMAGVCGFDHAATSHIERASGLSSEALGEWNRRLREGEGPLVLRPNKGK